MQHVWISTAIYTISFVGYVVITSTLPDNNDIGFAIIATPIISVFVLGSSAIVSLIVRNNDSNKMKLTAVYLSPVVLAVMLWLISNVLT